MVEMYAPGGVQLLCRNICVIRKIFLLSGASFLCNCCIDVKPLQTCYLRHEYITDKFVCVTNSSVFEIF